MTAYWFYSYDEDSDLLKIQYYDELLEDYDFYICDAEGNLIEVRHYDVDGVLEGKRIYQ